MVLHVSNINQRYTKEKVQPLFYLIIEWSLQ